MRMGNIITRADPIKAMGDFASAAQQFIAFFQQPEAAARLQEAASTAMNIKSLSDEQKKKYDEAVKFLQEFDAKKVEIEKFRSDTETELKEQRDKLQTDICTFNQHKTIVDGAHEKRTSELDKDKKSLENERTLHRQNVILWEENVRTKSADLNARELKVQDDERLHGVEWRKIGKAREDVECMRQDLDAKHKKISGLLDDLSGNEVSPQKE